MSNAVLYPDVPYTGLINGKFGGGRIIHISGSIPNYAYRFDIALQCGPQGAPKEDVAFQVSVDLAGGSISLNSFQNGLWSEPEQRPTVLKRGENFDIAFKCDTSYYKVLVNGQQYLLSQTVGCERITHIMIIGNVSIHKIAYDFESSDIPHPLPGQAPTHTVISSMSAQNHNLRFSQIPPYPVSPYNANSSFISLNSSSSGLVQAHPNIPNNSAIQPAFTAPNSAYPSSKNMNLVQGPPYISNSYSKPPSNELHPSAGFNNPTQHLIPSHPSELPPGTTVYYPDGHRVPGTSLRQPYGAPPLVIRRQVSFREECEDCLGFFGVKKRKRWFGIAGVVLMIILIVAIVVLTMVKRGMKYENSHHSLTTHHRIDDHSF